MIGEPPLLLAEKPASVIAPTNLRQSRRPSFFFGFSTSSLLVGNMSLNICRVSGLNGMVKVEGSHSLQKV